MKHLRNFIISIIISILFFKCFNYYLEDNISKNYNENIGKIYGNKVKDKGNTILNRDLNNNNIIFLGSSELGAKVQSNPKDFFPIQQFKNDASIFGRAGVQNLEHSLNIGGYGNKFNNDKVVYIVSLQWFKKKDMHKSPFTANFSELKFYKYLKNKSISKENKKYMAHRVNKFLLYDSQYKYAKLYIKLHTSDKFIHKIEKVLLEPYYFFRIKILESRDKFYSYKLLKKYNSNTNKSLKDINWDKEYKIMDKSGSKECTNNKFYVRDTYYNEYLKNRISSLKGVEKNIDLQSSNEYEDYKLFLKTCNDLNIKPLIVLMPVNGYYYDYIGLDREKRVDFYNTVQKIGESYGFEVLNLYDKEYEKFYMCDVMHLGWKGWLDIDEKVIKHFNK